MVPNIIIMYTADLLRSFSLILDTLQSSRDIDNNGSNESRSDSERDSTSSSDEDFVASKKKLNLKFRLKK